MLHIMEKVNVAKPDSVCCSKTCLGNLKSLSENCKVQHTAFLPRALTYQMQVPLSILTIQARDEVQGSIAPLFGTCSFCRWGKTETSTRLLLPLPEQSRCPTEMSRLPGAGTGEPWRCANGCCLFPPARLFAQCAYVYILISAACHMLTFLLLCRSRLLFG